MFPAKPGYVNPSVGNSNCRQPYTGSGGSVTIPSTINGRPVTSIGAGAFYNCTSLTMISIGNSVTNIGNSAFEYCTSLTSITFGNSETSIGQSAFEYCTSLINVTIPTNVTSIGSAAFTSCTSLTNVRIGNSVTIIGDMTFQGCTSLINVTIGKSVNRIGDNAFWGCTSLMGVYFLGNVPTVGLNIFSSDNNSTIYYLAGAKGWGPTFYGQWTALWNAPALIKNIDTGFRTNHFGFTVTGATGLLIVVEACTDLANPIWFPVGTNYLNSGTSYFSDPQWTNYPSRFYRTVGSR
jgi:hypothetical protein